MRGGLLWIAEVERKVVRMVLPPAYPSPVAAMPDC